jgi:serine/threonine protein kinase
MRLFKKGVVFLLFSIDKYDSGDWHIESVLSEKSFTKVYKISKPEYYGIKTYAALKVIPVPQSYSDISNLISEGLSSEMIDHYINDQIKYITAPVQLMQKLRYSPNIAIYDDCKVIPKQGETGFLVLLRMEFLDSLSAAFSNRKLTENDTIKIGIDISRALEALAPHKIVHRNVKPDNIFYSKSGNYKLSDFGIARQIEESSTNLSVRGTYSYMAPEVYHKLKYDNSVDLYSLGMVLYRFSNNGRVPFLPKTKPEMSDREKALQQRLRGDPIPTPQAASPELAKILLKALAYDRNDRFNSPTEMRKALERIYRA